MGRSPAAAPARRRGRPRADPRPRSAAVLQLRGGRALSGQAAPSVDPLLLEILDDPARRHAVREGIVVSTPLEYDDATQARWEDQYRRAAPPPDDVFVHTAVDLIAKHWRPTAGARFLELGCGTMRIGAALADRGVEAVGVDFSPTALLAARSQLMSKGHPPRLVLADIRTMPFRASVFDAIYGGGVVEHVRELDPVLRELHRITKPGGVTINTVPYLSLGALTYRQIWGNVPSVPVLRHFAEFVHVRLLRGRHMRFGYERSYPGWTLRRAFRRAGFVDVAVEHFDVPLVFEYLPGARLRKLARRLAHHRLFWPMVCVVARRPG